MDNTHPLQIKRKDRVRSPMLHVIQRRFALYAAGSSQRELAKQLNVSQAAVSGTISGLYTSAPVAAKLAEVTGLSLNELWPDGKYQEERTA